VGGGGGGGIAQEPGFFAVQFNTRSTEVLAETRRLRAATVFGEVSWALGMEGFRLVRTEIRMGSDSPRADV
jgi:hypothetical protein